MPFFDMQGNCEQHEALFKPVKKITSSRCNFKFDDTLHLIMRCELARSVKLMTDTPPSERASDDENRLVHFQFESMPALTNY